jgi:16S rRNA (uracil1498-N3)-methyltransferase
MHRFYLSPERSRGDKLVLEEREAHHALKVLRLGRGDAITVLDGEGAVYSCEIAGSAKSTVQLQVLEKRIVPALPWRITLFQAIPKGKLFEDIVEKATELGADRIVPILSQRVVSTPENPERKLERWNLAAIEAIKQCGSAWLPKIELPKSIADAIVKPEQFDLSLVGSLQSGSEHPKHWLDSLQPKSEVPVCLAVWIGPEGDFTSEEISFLENSGVRPMTLGPNVLRCETAAIFSLSILSSELQWRYGQLE